MKREWVSGQINDPDKRNIRAVSMRGRNCQHRKTGGERGNTWAREEKSGDHQREALQKVFLEVTVRESSCQNERAMTSEKLEIRGLKCFSYECGVSEFHAGLAGSLGIASSKKGSQEKRAEKECPHDAKSSMKSRKGGPLPLQWPRRYTICIK